MQRIYRPQNLRFGRSEVKTTDGNMAGNKLAVDISLGKTSLGKKRPSRPNFGQVANLFTVTCIIATLVIYNIYNGDSFGLS